MTQQRKGDWFQTYSGLAFWPLDPRPDEVDIGDIAHSLAMQCRFNGHVRAFYSVAQHSVLVASLLPPPLKLWGLLHDAAEAYIGDMVRPLKLSQPSFQAVEADIMRVVVKKFGLDPLDEPPEVKQADNVLLMTERRDLLAPPPQAWTPRAEPLPEIIAAWSPAAAEAAFLYWWTQYTHAESVSKQARGVWDDDPNAMDEPPEVAAQRHAPESGLATVVHSRLWKVVVTQEQAPLDHQQVHPHDWWVVRLTHKDTVVGSWGGPMTSTITHLIVYSRASLERDITRHLLYHLALYDPALWRTLLADDLQEWVSVACHELLTYGSRA